MPHPTLRSIALSLAALTLSGAAAADTKAVYQSANGKETMTIAVKGPMARWEADQFKKDQRYALFDSNRGVIVIVDDGRKEIMEIKPEEIRKTREQMQSQLAPMMKQLQEQMKNMPAEQRRMFEKQMSSMMPAQDGAPKTTYTTQKIGSGSVMSIPCTRHSVLRDGKPMHEVCIATPAAAKVSAADYKTIKKMFETMREMASAAASTSVPMGGDIDGMPLEMKNNADGQVHSIKSLSTSTLPAEDFKLPAYKSASFGSMIMPGAQNPK